jgi:hypothetical protein
LAAILPTQAAELATSQAEIALGSRSSSKTSLVAGTSTYVEQMNSSQEITEAESLAAVTDQVMAAWDISEWWNAAPISSNHKNEAI